MTNLTKLNDVFAPLVPFGVGFDSFPLFGNFASQTVGYPPHNIVKSKNGTEYYVEIALAGFNKDDVKIETIDNTLIISGQQHNETDEKLEYVYKGISNKSFVKKFALAENIKVATAKFDDGILTVSLEVEIPEAKKPKLIQIK